jgi:RNA polymerase sigma-70 factor, ECF subfamily
MAGSGDPADGRDELDDAAVIARVLDGDRQAFARLVERHQAALYRFAVSMVLDHEAAADMVQDAFVRAYVALASCRDRARFRAWLFQTLRNRCLDYLKDARRKSVPLDEIASVSDGSADPGECVERWQVQERIRRALGALPDQQREAFVLRHVEGLSYDAMADLLGASESALKMRVLRAREALASHLQGSGVTKPSPARLSITRG